MRILLVGPDEEENLSLRYLAASLKQAGHDITYGRFNTVRDHPGVVRAAVHADMVGLSMCFQSRAGEFLRLAAAIKKSTKTPPLVVGGGHFASSEARDILRFHPDIDLIAIHEAEGTIVEIAHAAIAGTGFASIPGIAYRNAGNDVVFTPKRTVEADLDKLPVPHRDGPIPMLAGVPTAFLMGSRGCLGSCAYCAVTSLHRMADGKRFRRRSPESVADEMADLYRSRGIRQFIFHDDNFLLPSVIENHRRIDAFDAALKARNLRNIALTVKFRPGDVDASILRKLKKMGLIRVFLGIESASPAGLSCLNRRQSTAQSEAALDLCEAVGISSQFTIMMFHPRSTLETIAEDLQFMRRRVSHPLNFCRTELYSGTPLLQQMKDAEQARGSYKAWTYSISDPVANRICEISKKLFYDRAWGFESLHQRSIGIDHLSAVIGHFYEDRWVLPLRNRIRDWLVAVNTDTLDRLAALSERCASGPAHLDVGELEKAERESRLQLIETYNVLVRDIRELTGAAVRAKPTASRFAPIRLARHAAAAVLAYSLGACTGIGVNEYAPAPLEGDADGDGLLDQCELELFGTSPNNADSNGDGVADSYEDHDNDGLSNMDEQVEGGENCVNVAPPDAGDTDTAD